MTNINGLKISKKSVKNRGGGTGGTIKQAQMKFKLFKERERGRSSRGRGGEGKGDTENSSET